MVIIQQQGGFRTSYDPETGKLVRIELWERPEKRPQYSLARPIREGTVFLV
jgi:hypothetical protein